MRDYKAIMDRVIGLPVCTLITTGRTGTDFLQSLLDEHPNVMVFNGTMLFNQFWGQSQCVEAGEFDLADLLYEFVGVYIQRFKSRYDLVERKDQLGENMEEQIDLDLIWFKSEVINLMEGYELTSRNILLAIYTAYSICIGQDVEQKTLVFHHIHHAQWLDGFLKDFPEAKIICMTRDPRANFCSGVEHQRNYFSDRDNGRHVYAYIQRILADATVLDKFPNDRIAIRLEDLGKQEISMRYVRG